MSKELTNPVSLKVGLDQHTKEFSTVENLQAFLRDFETTWCWLAQDSIANQQWKNISHRLTHALSDCDKYASNQKNHHYLSSLEQHVVSLSAAGIPKLLTASEKQGKLVLDIKKSDTVAALSLIHI